MADLRREAIERRCDEREDGEQLCVPVAGDHLRRDRVGLEAEALAGDPLDLGIDCRVRAHRSRELPDPVRLERPGESCAVAVESSRPARELPAERRRLGVDAVRAPDADRVAVLLGAANDGVERAVELDEQELAGVLNLERQRRVDDVGRGEAVVHPPPLGPELLGDGIDERREIVVGDTLDLGDALGRRRLRGGANRRDIGGGIVSQFGPAVERRQLDLEPACEPPSSDQILFISGLE